MHSLPATATMNVDRIQTRLTVRVNADVMQVIAPFVEAFAVEHGLAAGEAVRTLIVLEELFTNLQKYGSRAGLDPGVADVGLELEGTRLTVQLADPGVAFDPVTQPAPDLDQPVDQRPIGGLGLHLLRAFSDDLIYRRSDGRNVLRLTRRVALIQRR
jgi:anti-sigma regulatory factor (Ser/Thr protein kinase)